MGLFDHTRRIRRWRLLTRHRASSRAQAMARNGSCWDTPCVKTSSRKNGHDFDAARKVAVAPQVWIAAIIGRTPRMATSLLKL
jgi:hypothetical protein